MLDLEEEARLDPAITFAPAQYANAGTIEVRFALLTGATGFVGAFLLDELLRTTEADVFCLVRAESVDAARTRVTRNLQGYGLWDTAVAERIRPVVGDIAEPLLGLSDVAFGNLARQIDTIYHSAGSTNALYSYDRLKATNVRGTHEVLRLAATGPMKPVHFLSTLAVLFSQSFVGVDRLSESTIPVNDPSLSGGYAQGKWVADRMVRTAQEQGLPASIYRFVRVMGDSRTGMMNESHDILPLVLKACVQMGTCPTLDIDVTMVPVDYVSRAVIHLSKQSRSYGQAFHLVTPRTIAWGELMDTVRSFGYQLDDVPYDQWRQEIRLRASQSDNRPFYMALLIVLRAPHYLFYERPEMDTSLTQAGLAGTDISCPPADPLLIGKYIAHWQKVGWFPPPQRCLEASAAL